jgi:hypothetical protein
MAHNLREELRHNLQRRISVMWRCGGTAACTTGILIQVGYDYIEMVGIMPTCVDDENSLPVNWADPQGLLLETVIPIRNVCAFVEDVPPGRKLSLPTCGVG